MKILPKTVIAFVVILVSTVAFGGSTQHTGPSKFSDQALADFSKKIERYAAQNSAQVFLISRLGQPLEDLPKGIKYTHVALAVYSEIVAESGKKLRGYSIYNLYQKADDLDRSELVIDYPVDFFSGAQSLKSTIVIPNQALQVRLFDLITSDEYRHLHNRHYSLVSNPYDNRYQNCTEYILDMLNAAIYATTDKAQLKVNTKAYFKPYTVKKNRLLADLGTIFTTKYTTIDHGRKIQTATFTTILNYLTEYNLVENVETFEWSDSAS